MSDLRIDITALDQLSGTIRSKASEVEFDSGLSHPHAAAFGSADVIAAVSEAATIQAAEAKTLAESVTDLGGAPAEAAAAFAAADKALAPSRGSGH